MICNIDRSLSSSCVTALEFGCCEGENTCLLKKKKQPKSAPAVCVTLCHRHGCTKVDYVTSCARVDSFFHSRLCFTNELVMGHFVRRQRTKHRFADSVEIRDVELSRLTSRLVGSFRVCSRADTVLIAAFHSMSRSYVI